MRRVIIALGLGVFFALMAGDSAAERKRGLCAPKIDLSRYAVSGKVEPLEGVTADLSGIAFCPSRKTLFCVINGTAQALEVTRDAKVKRTITLQGFHDTEGIAHARGTRFWVVEEQRGRVVLVELGPGVTKVVYGDVSKACREIHNIGGNKGLEGVAVGRGVGELFLVKEKRPRRVYHTRLKPKGKPKDGCQPVVSRTPWDAASGVWGALWNGKFDLAGVHFDRATGNLLVLSEEAQALIECTPSGTVLSILDLKGVLKQPEGVTMDDERTIWVCGEPNELVALRRKP